MSALTSREIHDEIQALKPLLSDALKALESVNGQIPRANYDYEKARDEAFLAAKSQGSTEGTAKAQATLAAAELKHTLDALIAQRRQCETEIHAWEKVIQAHAADAYALNSEQKLATVPS